MTTVLFACTHNAGRSQMAAAFFNRRADPRKARAISAGTRPGDRVHPVVLTAMREAGIDLEAARPQRLTSRSRAQSTKRAIASSGIGRARSPRGEPGSGTTQTRRSKPSSAVRPSA